MQIIPKGLRSFEAEDAEFFLELLPGPRDRNRLPESIRFWKNRIEEPDADKTFRVGLIYGPSGCGKSSLVKAGLLPRLSESVLPIYVEATANDTEARLLKQLRKHVPRLPADASLLEACAVSRTTGNGGGRKVLLVVDQFEQWLHAHSELNNAHLVDALRQCEGDKLQAVLLVRDDFYMSAYRVFQELEIGLIEGQNFTVVDLFDLEHAKQVLTAFGRAYGRLGDGLSSEEHRFVGLAVNDLAEDYKVISVRLSLFADMMKTRPWIPASLQQMGGVRGVGATFLEETFSAKSAPPSHRAHERAIRGVLGSLLPEAGTDIKGAMRSADELREAAGYADKRRAFDEVLHILDGEVRLITPTEPEGWDDEPLPGSSSMYYQLSHDYLVTPLRQWLTSKQRETRRGRAEIRLEERTNLWTARPEARQLPSLWEWLTIRLNTGKDRWTGSQQAMMQAAAKRHLSRLMIAAVLLVSIAALGAFARYTFLRQSERDRVNGLVSDLWRTEFRHLPRLIDELAPHRSSWEDRVSAIADDPASTPAQRTRGYLALARQTDAHLAYLQSQMLEAGPDEQRVFRDELRPWKDRLSATTWAATRNRALSHDQCIRAAAILAEYDPDNPAWKDLSPAVTNALVASDPMLVNPWLEVLHPVRRHMITPLMEVYQRAGSASRERILAASLLARFGSHDESLLTAQALTNLMLTSRPRADRILMPLVHQRGESILPLLRDELSAARTSSGGEAEVSLARQANAVETLFLLGDTAPFWSHLADGPDPRLRTLLIDRIAHIFEDWRLVTAHVDDAPDPCVRQALIIGLQGYAAELSEIDEASLWDRLLLIHREDPDAGVHSAAEWLLSSLRPTETRALSPGESASKCEACNWWIESNGLTMIRIERPGLITVGSPPDEFGRDNREEQREVTIDYPFAISATEVTVEQFTQFQPDFVYASDVTSTTSCPVNRTSTYDAMRFCRWLSEQAEDFDPQRCCYPPLEDIGPNMRLADDYLTRPGYRLPTVDEWEYAARAGSQTSRFFGDSEAYLDQYCWWAGNSQEHLWPVGRLRPNVFGLFDVHGNVSEWCHDSEATADASRNPFRGGDYRSTPRFLRSAMHTDQAAGRQLSVMGFRVVKISRPAD